MYKKNSLIKQITNSLIMICVVVVIMGQVEFNVTVKKSKINVLESLANTAKALHNGYKTVRNII